MGDELEFQVRELSDVLKEYPEFAKEVRWLPIPYGGLENPDFGRIGHKVMCDKDGKPIYDQPTFKQRPGSVVIPFDVYNNQIRVGLLHEERPITGQELVAFPRGIGKGNETALRTAYRELLEETERKYDAKVEDMEIIGYVFPDSAYFESRVPIVEARFEELIEVKNIKGAGVSEKIMSVRPYSFPETQAIPLDLFACGYTLAAQTLFIRKHPEFVTR